jgi:transcriptional regulator with XRE-family HTH domain
MPTPASPTVRRRTLGSLLRQHRVDAGFKATEVAERLLCHPSKITRIESGERAASARDVRDLCDIYGITDEAKRGRLMTLARESRQRGWWQEYDLALPAYVGLEAAASRLSNYESSIIPGLLQNAAYTTALLQATQPHLTEHQLAQAAEALQIRQANAFQDNRLTLWAIVDEAVLHRVCGSASVTKAQLTRLMDASSMPNVTLQVVPFGAGAFQALSSTFVMVEFDEPELTPVVLVEGLVGYIFLEQAADIARYRRALEELRRVAANPEDSVEIIRKARRRM